jgi:hypothetical protein
MPEPTIAPELAATLVPQVTAEPSAPPPVAEPFPPGPDEPAVPVEPALAPPALTPVTAEVSPRPTAIRTKSAPSEPTATKPATPPLAAEPSPAASPAVAPAVAPTRAASKRISIDFNDADVRTVIQLIASAGGFQVMFAPEVGGTITISLVDRPWEDALATVLRAKRLREVRHDDVMLVSPGK